MSTTLVLPLLASIVVPTVCVLWFMNRAVENERLAVGERLARANRSSLSAAASAYRAKWDERVTRITSGENYSAAGFAAVVLDSLASSVVFLDAKGVPIYPLWEPSESGLLPDSPVEALWEEARRAEYVDRDPTRAAELYGRIAGEETSPNQSAKALQAQARTLVKLGDQDSAVQVLTGRLQDDRFSRTADDQGRLIRPSALFRALQLTKDSEPRRRLAAALVKMLNDYSHDAMPSSQRYFLMTAVVEGGLATPRSFPTLDSEALARLYLESIRRVTRFNLTVGQWVSLRATGNDSFRLSQSDVPGVWQATADDGGAVFLFTDRFIRDDYARVAGDLGLTRDLITRIVPPGASTEDVKLSAPIGGVLEGWRIDMVTDPALFDGAADRRVILYVWVGGLSVVLMVLVATFSVRSIRYQARLARLKNDLVATVSHELKTPIASIKVLVDTLLDGHYKDADRTADYLALISAENDRLARLVANFLAFSRVEQKRAYERSRCNVQEIVDEALEPIRDQLEAEGFEVDVRVDRDVPHISGDRGALVSALTNLIENAHKFSGDSRRIAVRASGNTSTVRLTVIDQGIGMTRLDARRVFDRFYQADMRLARESSGVGLGLSIVKGIVEGHGGKVSVESEPGKGSTFEMSLPAGSSGDVT